MKKGIVTVFIVIGILVLGLIIWAVVFNGGFQQAFEAVANTINGIWGGLVGDDSQLVNANQLTTGSNYKNLGSNARSAFGG